MVSTTVARKRLWALFGILVVLLVVFAVLRFWRGRMNRLTSSAIQQSSDALALQLEQLKAESRKHPNDAKVHFELGMIYGRQKFYIEAAEHFEQALRLGLDTPELHGHLGSCYRNLGDLVAAEHEYKEAIQRDPNKIDHWLRLVALYLEGGQLEYARLILRRLRKDERFKEIWSSRPSLAKMRKFCDSPPEQVFEELAVRLAQVGDTHTALRLGKLIQKFVPNHPAGHAIVGKCYLTLGVPDKALPFLQRAAQLAPYEPELHYLVGRLLSRNRSKENLTAALQAFERAVRLNPGDGRYYEQMAIVLSRLGQWRKAGTAFTTAARLPMATPEMWRRAAEAFEKAKEPVDAAICWAHYCEAKRDFPAALKWAHKVVRHEPQGEHGYLVLAHIYEAMNQPRAALQVVRKGVKRVPKSRRLHAHLAEVCYQLNDLDEREQALKKLVALDPNRADEGYRELGALYLHKGRYDEAERCFEKCVAMRPQDGPYHYALAKAYLMRQAKGDRLRKAIEHLEQAVQLDPTNVVALEMLGTSYIKAGRLEDAAAILRRVINLEPGYGEAYLHCAKVYQKLKNRQKAKWMLERYRRFQKFKDEHQLLRTRARANPKNPASQFALAQFYLKAGDALKAEQHLKRVVTLAPNHVEAHRLLASIYASLNRPEEEARERRIIARLHKRRSATPD